MNDWLQAFVLTFVPLFIVIDAIGTLPFILTMSEGMTTQERYRMIHIAILTAAIVGLVFLFFGQLILSLLGISVGAFAIAGGTILFVLSLTHMTTGRLVEFVKEEMAAVVPIGTPLVVGPATITTLLLLVSQYPPFIVLISFALNILISWLIFLLGNFIARFLGRAGLKAVSRVFSLLLAAIAVDMIFRGLKLMGILAAAG